MAAPCRFESGRRIPSNYQYRASMRKMALAITDVRQTARDEIVEVTLAETGKPMRLRRDMAEFWPGKVVVPLWLGLRVMPTPAPHLDYETKQGLGFSCCGGVGGQNLNGLPAD